MVYHPYIRAKMQVVSLVGLQKASLHPDDMLLLANFVMSSESFRQVCYKYIIGQQ